MAEEESGGEPLSDASIVKVYNGTSVAFSSPATESSPSDDRLQVVELFSKDKLTRPLSPISESVALIIATSSPIGADSDTVMLLTIKNTGWLSLISSTVILMLADDDLRGVPLSYAITVTTYLSTCSRSSATRENTLPVLVMLNSLLLIE